MVQNIRSLEVNKVVSIFPCWGDNIKLFQGESLMPKVTVEGLYGSEGAQGFPVLDNGEYLVEINKVTPSESENSPADLFNFECSIIEGPDQESGRAPDGQKVFHMIAILRPDHPKAEYRHIGIDQFKAWALAADVNVTKNDNIVVDDFIGKQVVVRLGTEESPGGDLRNKVTRVKAVE